MNIIAFWDTAPCSLVEVEEHFRGDYCLQHRGRVTAHQEYTAQYPTLIILYCLTPNKTIMNRNVCKEI
jgi:hypothetical protein